MPKTWNSEKITWLLVNYLTFLKLEIDWKAPDKNCITIFRSFCQEGFWISFISEKLNTLPFEVIECKNQGFQIMGKRIKLKLFFFARSPHFNPPNWIKCYFCHLLFFFGHFLANFRGFFGVFGIFWQFLEFFACQNIISQPKLKKFLF